MDIETNEMYADEMCDIERVYQSYFGKKEIGDIATEVCEMIIEKWKAQQKDMDKTRVIIRDGADHEIYGIAETSDKYTGDEVCEKIQELKNEWFATDNGQYLTEYLTENLPKEIDIYTCTVMDI